MPRNKIVILDKLGNTVGTINGIAVNGPAVGAKNIGYIPEGAIVSGIGTASFDLPLQFTQNNAIQKDTQIMIYQEDVYDGPVFWGRVTKRPRTLSADGTFTNIQCEDVLAELASVTCTSGFISRPLELANAMLQRLVARQTETAWTVRSTLPNIQVNFSAYGIEVIRAIGKYAGEHFASYKRETAIDPVTGKPRRQVVIGQFSSISSGMRLINAPKDWASVPYEKKPAEIRVIRSASYEEDTTILNRLIPTAGSDLNAASITLQPLYGIAGYTGYNPAYPVKRRLREDITVPTPIPGALYPNTAAYWEYYIEDTASITAHRLEEANYPRQDITPLSTNAGDVLVAVTTLYTAAVTYLIDHINPHTSLSIVTDHRGDIRNIGGKTVYVRCQAVNAKKDFVMDIDGDYRVQSVEITNADGDGNCKWNLSSDGRSTETDDVLFQGALEDIDYLKKVPTLLMAFPVYPIDDFIDNANYMHLVFPNSDAFLAAQQVILDLRLLNVRSAIRPLSHTHTFSLTDHTHSFSLLDHTHAFSLLDHTHTLTLQDHTHSFSVLDHTHSMSGTDHSHSASTSDHDHGFTFGTHSHAIISTKPWVDLQGAGAVVKAGVGKNGEQVVTGISGTANTADHTHGMGAVSITSASDVQNGGGFSINTGSGGGFSGATGGGGGVNGVATGGGGAVTNKATGGGGAVNGATGGGGAVTNALTGGGGGIGAGLTGGSAGSEWGLIIGPKPAIIDIAVNGTYIGAIAVDTRLDITPYWKVKGDNVIDIVSRIDPTNITGLGRIGGAVLARMIGTTLANQTL